MIALEGSIFSIMQLFNSKSTLTKPSHFLCNLFIFYIPMCKFGLKLIIFRLTIDRKMTNFISINLYRWNKSYTLKNMIVLRKEWNYSEFQKRYFLQLQDK